MAPIWQSYVEPGKTNAILYVVDASSPETLGTSTIHLIELLNHTSIANITPILIVFRLVVLSYCPSSVLNYILHNLIIINHEYHSYFKFKQNGFEELTNLGRGEKRNAGWSSLEHWNEFATDHIGRIWRRYEEKYWQSCWLVYAVYHSCTSHWTSSINIIHSFLSFFCFLTSLLKYLCTFIH